MLFRQIKCGNFYLPFGRIFLNLVKSLLKVKAFPGNSSKIVRNIEQKNFLNIECLFSRCETKKHVRYSRQKNRQKADRNERRLYKFPARARTESISFRRTRRRYRRTPVDSPEHQCRCRNLRSGGARTRTGRRDFAFDRETNQSFFEYRDEPRRCRAAKQNAAEARTIDRNLFPEM